MKRSRSRREDEDDDDDDNVPATIHARRQRDIDAEVERMQAIHEEHRRKRRTIEEELESKKRRRADQRKEQVGVWREVLGADVFQDLVAGDVKDLEKSLASNLVLFFNEHWPRLLDGSSAAANEPSDDKAYVKYDYMHTCLTLHVSHRFDYACFTCRERGYDTKTCMFEMDWCSKKIPAEAEELLEDEGDGGVTSNQVYFLLPDAVVAALPPIPCAIQHI